MAPISSVRSRRRLITTRRMRFGPARWILCARQARAPSLHCPGFHVNDAVRVVDGLDKAAKGHRRARRVRDELRNRRIFGADSCHGRLRPGRAGQQAGRRQSAQRNTRGPGGGFGTVESSASTSEDRVAAALSPRGRNASRNLSTSAFRATFRGGSRATLPLCPPPPAGTDGVAPGVGRGRSGRLRGASAAGAR